MNNFNDHFLNAVETDGEIKGMKIRACSNNQSCPYDRTFFVYPTDVNEISSVVRSLKTKYSAGYDNIPSKLLKNILQPICAELVKLCDESLSQGIFQKCLKKSHVVSISKKGDREEFERIIK
ncbi:hypothetical protein JTB14_022730 [Gonioctena quinquepunctata]|nr:hypothetical protein JTB14_022730 [Gonioctena quinquepunctata]